MQGTQTTQQRTHPAPPEVAFPQLPGAIVWESDPWGLRARLLTADREQLWGFSADEWAAEERFLERHVHPEDWTRLLASMYEAAADGSPQTCDHRLVTKRGRTRWARTVSQRVDATETAKKLRGVSFDVTPFKETEQALRHAESSCRRMLEDVRDVGLFTVSADGLVEHWTPGAQRLTGYVEQDVVGNGLQRLFSRESPRDETISKLLARARVEHRASYEGPIVRRDGEAFFGNLIVHVTEERGRVTGFTLCLSDVTEQQRLTDGLRRSEEQFRRLVENVWDYALFMMTPSGVIEGWNPGAQRLSGYRTEEIVGQQLSNFFPPDQIQDGATESLLDQAVRKGSGCYEGYLVRKGGSRFWAVLNVDAVEDDEGRLLGFASVARDLTGRRATEEALRHSEEHFRLLVDSVQEYAMFMISPEGVVESWNKGARRLNGYRALEVIGHSFEQFFRSEDIAKGTPAQLLEHASRDGAASYEGWLVRKGGYEFWGLLTLSAVEEEDGRLRGFSNVARDLTDRRRNEQMLRENEELTRLLLESLSDHGLFMASPDGIVASWSPAAEQVHGHRSEQILGKPMVSLFPKEKNAFETVSRLLECAASEGRAEFEGWLLRGAGKVFWGSLLLSPVTDGRGNMRGFSVLTRDLTDRVQAQREQAFFSEASRVLAETLDVDKTLEKIAALATQDIGQWCIVGLLTDGLIEPVACSHHLPEQRALLEKSVETVSSHEPLGQSHGLAHVVASGKSEVYTDARHQGWLAQALGIRDGAILRELGVQSYMCVPLTAHGNILGAMAFVSSAAGVQYGLRELHLAEELARRAALAVDNARSYEEVRRAVRVREDILAVVSHDLRNPLNSIALGAAVLASGKCSDVAAIASRIQRATAHMERLIRELLDLAALEAKKLSLSCQSHTARALVDEAIEILQPIAAAKDVVLEEQPSELDAEVVCDRPRIIRVLSNLMSNAIKFSDEGGKVSVSAKRGQGQLSFLVRDTGPGIAASELPHIFDRYWKSPQANSHHGGLGLGLSIVKSIVEAHGGTVTLESQVGKGSTFCFTLPLSASGKPVIDGH